jgi:hypothetical protein
MSEVKYSKINHHDEKERKSQVKFSVAQADWQCLSAKY